jgi:hypothetical protein
MLSWPIRAGETLPLHIMFPKARLLVYREFFCGDQGRDVDFDPEFPKAGLDGHIRLKLKNATTLLALNDANFGVSPIEWQRSTFPIQYQDKIATIHEGGCRLGAAGTISHLSAAF